MVLQMCEESNNACYATSAATSDDGESSQRITHPIHYPKLPCRIVVVNEMEYYVKLHNAKINLLGDGMRLEMESLAHLTDSTPAFTSTTHFTETLKKSERLMHICDHHLHHGHIYSMPPEARMTFVKMMDVESYLNKLMRSEKTSSNISIA